MVAKLYTTDFILLFQAMLQVARHLFTNLGELEGRFPDENDFPCIKSRGSIVSLSSNAMLNSLVCPEWGLCSGDSPAVSCRISQKGAVNEIGKAAVNGKGNNKSPTSTVTIVVQDCERTQEKESNIHDNKTNNKQLPDPSTLAESMNVDQYLPVPSVSQTSFVTANSETEADNEAYESLNNSSAEGEQEEKEDIPDNVDDEVFEEPQNEPVTSLQSENKINLRTDLFGFPPDKEKIEEDVKTTFSDPVIKPERSVTPKDSKPELNTAFLNDDDSDGNCVDLEGTVHENKLEKSQRGSCDAALDTELYHDHRRQSVGRRLSFKDVVRGLNISDTALGQAESDEEPEVDDSAEVTVMVEVVGLSAMQAPSSQVGSVTLGR